MKQYLELLVDVMNNGTVASNRTGTDTKFKMGGMLKFDLAEGFPVVTTKSLAWKAACAEMLGFLRGYDSADLFDDLGCKVWYDNANKEPNWLANLHRKGENDLGRVYGVQARDWRYVGGEIDQFLGVYLNLLDKRDDRRLIVNHWNVGELDQMALPPCHLMYQFGVENDRLNLAVYIRSSDMFLGLPFNIVGYAWLLSVMAYITGYTPGVLTVFLFNYHIYVNHFNQVCEQITRTPRTLPTLLIDPNIQTLEDLETWVTMDNFKLENYTPYPALYAPMAI